MDAFFDEAGQRVCTDFHIHAYTASNALVSASIDIAKGAVA